jgi:hypothetical protein
MTAPNITHFWASLLRAAAMLAIVLTVLGLMIGLVKPADLPKKLGNILGLVVALTILPDVLMSEWAQMSLWQQIGLAAIGVVILFVLILARKTRHRL